MLAFDGRMRDFRSNGLYFMVKDILLYGLPQLPRAYPNDKSAQRAATRPRPAGIATEYRFAIDFVPKTR